MPIIIISIGFLFLILNSVEQLKELQTLQQNNYKMKIISRLVTQLQQERGLSSGYLGSRGTKFVLQLKKVRKEVNNYDKELTLNKELLDIRRKIDKLHISTIESFSFYTKIIKELQMRYLITIEQINDAYLLKQLQTYTDLSFMKEALGQIRGSFNGIFSTKETLNKKLLYNALHAKGMYDISLERFYATSSPKFLHQLHSIIKSTKYKTLQNIIDKYSSLQIKTPNEDSQKWFELSTNIINEIDNIEKSYIVTIDEYIKNKSNTLKLQFISLISFLLLVFIFTSWLGYKLKNDILRSIALLNQYKDAVDRSSIVSKTDKKGKITYANDKFCSISGYSREELIGKPHNLVRHPEMPKSAFKTMWQTILSKKPWVGIVKNKTKNGNYYIVEATINPILNHKGEIEEFIAIRNNITDVIKLHEDLEHTQEELIFRMGEIGETRSQETGFHVKRVAKYSQLLAKFYGLNEDEIKYLTAASPMHDIGKVGIPDDILKKPGKLTQNEWSIMKKHTNIGYELFKDSDKPLLRTAAIISYEHHEKYDGSGYPRALKGEEIHIYGRITALADVFDALGSDRCYKKAWDDAKIFSLLKEERGKHFDPKLIDIFFEHLDEFLYIRDSFSDESSYMKEH